MIADSLQGQMLGKYRVLEPLGRGGMARVYRAYHPQLDRYVAIKVMRSDLVQDDEFLARFRREARAVAGLRHTHIVQVYDFDAEDDVYYMVMELLDGDTLKARSSDYRSRGEQMPLGEMVRVLLDVLDGLAYAHSEDMVHRDVKPANIMLTKRGRAVLMDFGIAQIIGGTRHTVSGALMGTLTYMAPEQGLEACCDARSDIYSLGIVFFEMLTQQVPFDADTPLAILMKHLNDPLPLPRQIDPTIPEPFERVLLKSLSKRPEDRYQSAEEMIQALWEAAQAAGIEVPARISLPLSFTTPEAPSESVAVLSGTAREKIKDAQFAAEETDTTLGQRLAAEMAASGSTERVYRRRPARPHRAPAREPLASHQVVGSVSGAIASFLALIGNWSIQMVPGVSKYLDAEIRGKPAKAILSGIGVVAFYNMMAVWIGGLSGWWIFGKGWPIELFVVGLGLCVIMYALSTIWLLIPAGILLGNGILFAYCQVTGNWEYWSFLWMFELLLVGGVIWLTIRLGRRAEASRQLSRPVGCGLGVAAAAWSIITAIAAAVAALVT
jgi:serine/threonine-protein kinase